MNSHFHALLSINDFQVANETTKTFKKTYFLIGLKYRTQCVRCMFFDDLYVEIRRSEKILSEAIGFTKTCFSVKVYENFFLKPNEQFGAVNLNFKNLYKGWQTFLKFWTGYIFRNSYSFQENRIKIYRKLVVDTDVLWKCDFY